jgi:hypothetical protein
LDHIQGDGKAHRKRLTAAELSLEEWLVQERYPRGVVRVLCRACHELKTWGVVRCRTAFRRFVYAITHTREGKRMPVRKGAHAIHITLASEAIDQLERLASLAPDQNKSLVVQGLILRTITDHTGEYNGHFADILSSVEQRLTLIPDTVATQLTQISTTAQTVTRTLITRQETFERIEGRLVMIEGILARAFPSPLEVERQRREQPPLPWWRRVLIGLLIDGSLSWRQRGSGAATTYGPTR